MAEKKIETWEREKGVVIAGADPNKTVTEAEFADLSRQSGIGVNFADREKFLKDNGYEVNRENLVDSNLSATK